MKLKSHSRATLDARLEPLGERGLPPMPHRGWIRAIREGLGMTARQLGRRLGITQQAVAEMEKSESTGRVRMHTLSRAAEAMNCDLVYVLIPRQPLQQQVEARARALALATLTRTSHSMTLEDQAVAGDLEARVSALTERGLRLRDLWEEA